MLSVAYSCPENSMREASNLPIPLPPRFSPSVSPSVSPSTTVYSPKFVTLDNLAAFLCWIRQPQSGYGSRRSSCRRAIPENAPTTCGNSDYLSTFRSRHALPLSAIPSAATPGPNPANPACLPLLVSSPCQKK